MKLAKYKASFGLKLINTCTVHCRWHDHVSDDQIRAKRSKLASASSAEYFAIA